MSQQGKFFKSGILFKPDPSEGGWFLAIYLNPEQEIRPITSNSLIQQTKHCTHTMIDRYNRVQHIVRHNAAMKLG